MLYTKNNNESLGLDLFKNPTSEYRGTPFWSWNCRVTKEQISEQIEDLKEMGMGGFHIHCRSGMDVRYLSDEFMDLVKESNSKAKENNMLCWLYDEDRWPSGFAGGLVTKDIKYRARFLVFSPYKYEDENEYIQEYDSTARAQRSNNRELLGKYQVVLKDGFLHGYNRLAEDEEGDGDIWWAYLEVSGDNPWYNNQSYVNTLDKEAIKEFIRITHERYYGVLGDEFGKSVPAIFTDEPQFTHKEILGYANEKKELTIPFTDDFEETFIKTYGESFLNKLPEIFWELPDGEISVTRYHYHDHVSERFTESFADTIGMWCKEHGIMLTGHMMEEPSLGSQTAALGEAMRSYRSFQLPGIDMLCDWREYSTAKQAQSASHQYGCPGVLSELYGVTNWDFDFRGHKLQGDWQAALGVTTRVHHLTWMSMNGEAKRDYPASIGYQSPWYKEYSLIEDYFSRLNTALTRGKASVRVGVIHPIESYWLHFGPKEHTDDIRRELEENFNNIINWLLFSLIDFDFICESLLPDQSEIKESCKFQVGKMEYDVVIVPGCETLRSTTIDRLEAFQKGGGKIIFLGEVPTLENAAKSDRGINLADKCINLSFTKTKLLRQLEEYRDIKVMKDDGSQVDNLLYQMREDNENKWLFLCHVNKMDNNDISYEENIVIKIRGLWNATIYDCITGETYKCSYNIRENDTIINHVFFQHDSLLVLLEPLKENSKFQLDCKASIEVDFESKVLGSPISIQLSEPNVYILDMAQYSLNNEPWSDKEEVLRIDNILRKRVNYPLKMSALAQPWTMDNEEKHGNRVKLKYTINSNICVKNAYIALEDAEETEIIVNGSVIDNTVVGWYVDKCIKKVKLPILSKGNNEIILDIPFEPKSNMEWCYLLGDFGVRVEGNTATIIEPVRNLLFGDWTTQGLPFYAGNVTYICEIESQGESIEVEIPQFRNPLLSVTVHGDEKGKIAFSPYKLELGCLDKGKHIIMITAYGNRINTFGTIHNCNTKTLWYGPDAWRTTGTSWSYEYQIKPTGVLVSPILKYKIE